MLGKPISINLLNV